MDHLPYPVGTQRHVQIKCSAEVTTYYPEDFFKYPVTQGLIYEDLLENGLPEEYGDGFAEEFLQSWLWFALLAQVLGEPVNAHDFVQSHGPKPFIHTRPLNGLLQDWTRREIKELESRKVFSSKQKLRYFRASAALSDARRFVVKHLSCDRIGQGHLHDSKMTTSTSYIQPELTLSLAILGKTLQHSRPKLFPRLQSTEPFWTDPTLEDDSWGCSFYCRQRLLQNGWCPNDVYRLESTLDGIEIMYYASELPAPDANYVPGKSWDHSECSVWECINNDGRCYNHEYHMPSCAPSFCERLGINITDSELIRYIQRGETPLVTFEDDGKIHCRGYTLDDSLRFGVVSHTWEDKIIHSVPTGDPSDRQILLCHVIDLQRNFDRLIKTKDDHHDTPKHVPFWVDVLCNPSRPSMIGKVLDSTRDIYSKASAVLVWDRELLNIDRPNSLIEANLRIRTSQWAQRLWTFSEAVLAKRIFIKFRNDEVDMKAIGEARKCAKRDLLNEHHHVWKAGYPFSLVTWRLRKAIQALDSGSDHEEAKYAVQWAWQAVQFRKVTNAADETKVMAQVLGLEAASIAEIDDLGGRSVRERVAAKRMARFIDLLDASEGLGIPSGIIFLPGPFLGKLLPQTPGYEWAPQTWLSRQAHAYPLFRPLKPAAKMHKRGLLVNFPGLTLLCPSNPPEQHKLWVAVHQSLHKWYKVVVEVCEGFHGFWTNKVRSSQEASIIMCTDEPRERWEIGVLVTTEGRATQGQIRVVKVLCRVWMRLETNPNIVKIMQDRVRQDPNGTFFAEHLIKDTEWCITGNEMLGTNCTH